MAGSSDKNTVLNRLKEIKNMMEQVIRYCGKYRETVLNTDELLSYKKDDSYANAHETINSDINKYIAKEYIAAASEIQKDLEQNMYAFLIDKPDKDNARICEFHENIFFLPAIYSCNNQQQCCHTYNIRFCICQHSF